MQKTHSSGFDVLCRHALESALIQAHIQGEKLIPVLGTKPIEIRDDCA